VEVQQEAVCREKTSGGDTPASHRCFIGGAILEEEF